MPIMKKLSHIILCWKPVWLLVFGISIAGCATPPKHLYQWDGYQEQIWAGFNGEADPKDQIIALEALKQKALSQGELLPPGFHAHLALMYAKDGQLDKVPENFNAEKDGFPESADYMDFLLRNFKK